ncbi:O-linked N-acetylglucosamine transferase family protein, partial [Selenomonas sp. oral taxon 126]|uniref:O-linked N-acetylglucosamine transferase family protein n=1 Tax=Selenomonas sp. oral taxon 126 TaxID=712528 RepID=UPI003FA68283
SRLLLKTSGFCRRGIARAAWERLGRLGFDLNRVMLEEATRDYMERYLDVDIALDTFPWPGGGTTCDALYMGVPVVSYYTERHSTRFTYSLLANIGLGDLASERMEDYVETAVALAGNPELLDALHRELRDRMKASPVMDQERYIREMEECYRAIWAQWEAHAEDV